MRPPSTMNRRPVLTALIAALLLPLSGCELLGIESAEAVAARREAEGKAVGSACRHAARALEDCFALNRKADKAAIFAGWREMNDYMRENQIEAVAPQLGPGAELAGKAPHAGHDEAAPAPAAEPRPAPRGS